MRTKEHYEYMLDQNPKTGIGFSLAADMVFSGRRGRINRAEDHGSDTWRQIAKDLKDKYGEVLTVADVRTEMTVS